jgi:hypothetical protein
VEFLLPILRLVLRPLADLLLVLALVLLWPVPQCERSLRLGQDDDSDREVAGGVALSLKLLFGFDAAFFLAIVEPVGWRAGRQRKHGGDDEDKFLHEVVLSCLRLWLNAGRAGFTVCV